MVDVGVIKQLVNPGRSQPIGPQRLPDFHPRQGSTVINVDIFKLGLGLAPERGIRGDALLQMPHRVRDTPDAQESPVNT